MAGHPRGTFCVQRWLRHISYSGPRTSLQWSKVGATKLPTGVSGEFGDVHFDATSRIRREADAPLSAGAALHAWTRAEMDRAARPVPTVKASSRRSQLTR